jgi:hypothetical protein
LLPQTLSPWRSHPPYSLSTHHLILSTIFFLHGIGKTKMPNAVQTGDDLSLVQSLALNFWKGLYDDKKTRYVLLQYLQKTSKLSL